MQQIGVLPTNNQETRGVAMQRKPSAVGPQRLPFGRGTVELRYPWLGSGYSALEMHGSTLGQVYSQFPFLGNDSFRILQFL